MGLEGAQLLGGLPLERDHHEDRDGPAHGHRVNPGVIATYNACPLKVAHASERGRRRQADTPSQLDIAHPTVLLEFAQKFPVGVIKLGHFNAGHTPPPLSITL